MSHARWLRLSRALLWASVPLCALAQHGTSHSTAFVDHLRRSIPDLDGPNLTGVVLLAGPAAGAFGFLGALAYTASTLALPASRPRTTAAQRRRAAASATLYLACALLLAGQAAADLAHGFTPAALAFGFTSLALLTGAFGAFKIAAPPRGRGSLAR